MKFSSLADLRDRVANQTTPSGESAARAREIQQTLTKPPGSLGRLETIAEFLAGWQQSEHPKLENVQALVFAGNHGVCAQKINPYPQSVTAQMVDNFRTGGAAINQLCETFGAKLSVTDLELDRPTGDFTQTMALPEQECLSAINIGAAAVDSRADALILGEMGIGNSTVAAALATALYGGAPEQWVGPGTGSDSAGIERKTQVVAEGIARHEGKLGDPLQILMAFGGREQAAIVGAILAARAHSVPVLLDGFICSASAAVLERLHPASLEHCLAGHCSAEPGHDRLLQRLGKQPLLRLDMRLGEGSGAALALAVLRAAVACHSGMATSDSAGLDEPT